MLHLLLHFGVVALAGPRRAQLGLQLPQVVGLSQGETDSLAGRTARLYVGGYSEALLEFSLLPKAPPALVPGPGENVPPGTSDGTLGQAEPEHP